MPVNLSIKNVSDEVVQILRERAARNHRSLQGELMTIIEEAAASTQRRKLTVAELSDHIRSMGLTTPSESVQMIREDRDSDDR